MNTKKELMAGAVVATILAIGGGTAFAATQQQATTQATPPAQAQTSASDPCGANDPCDQNDATTDTNAAAAQQGDQAEHENGQPDTPGEAEDGD